MKAGKITAKLRDAVKVHFVEEDHPDSPMIYKNIEIPDELKNLELKEFEFLMMGDKIEFEISFDKGTLPAIKPDIRPKVTRAQKMAEKVYAERQAESRAREEAAKKAADQPAAPVASTAPAKPTTQAPAESKPATPPATKPAAPPKIEKKPATLGDKLVAMADKVGPAKPEKTAAQAKTDKPAAPATKKPAAGAQTDKKPASSTPTSKSADPKQPSKPDVPEKLAEKAANMSIEPPKPAPLAKNR